MGIDTSGMNAGFDAGTTEPGGGMLPEGTESFGLEVGGGIDTSGMNAAVEVSAGFQAKVDAAADGVYVDGTAYLYYNDRIIDSEPFNGDPKTLKGVPQGVVSGNSYEDRATDPQKVLNTTEEGGVDTLIFTGSTVTHLSSFDEFSVKVFDADGSPVAGDKVVFDSTVAMSTDDNGRLTFQSSGTVDVDALDGSLSDTVDLANNPGLVEYQYAGVKGTISTPDGDPVGGKTVKLTDDQGYVIATTETDEEGQYRFPVVPINTSVYVFNDPYFREAASRGQGQFVTKRFPSTLMLLGDVDDYTQVEEADVNTVIIECIDAESGGAIAGLAANVGGYELRTGSNGKVSATVQSSNAAGEQTATVTLGENNRYRKTSLEVDRDNPTVGTVELERYLGSDDA